MGDGPGIGQGGGIGRGRRGGRRGTWPRGGGGSGRRRGHGGRFGVRGDCDGRRSWELFGEEGFRGDDEVDEGAEGVFVFLKVGDGCVEVGLVRVTHFPSEGVGEELGCEAAEEKVFLGEELILKAGHAGEFGAVGHFGGGVDDGIIFADAALVAEAFLGSPFAGGVVVFEGEAEGVDFVVAAGALREFAVDGEALADGGFIDAGNLGGDLADVGNGEAGIGAEEVFEDPGAAGDGGSTSSIRGHAQDGSLGDDAAARVAFWNGDFSDGIAFDAGDVVEAGEAFVDGDEVGAEEVEDAEVFMKDFVEEGDGFGSDGGFEVAVIARVEFGGGRVGADLAEVEPLAGEVVGEGLAFGRGEEAVDLFFENVGVIEIADGGVGGEVVVGLRGPEDVGEAGGEVVRIEGAGAG